MKHKHPNGLVFKKRNDSSKQDLLKKKIMHLYTLRNRETLAI